MTGKHVNEYARKTPRRVFVPPLCRLAQIIGMPDRHGTIAAQIARFRSQPPLPRDSRCAADASKQLRLRHPSDVALVSVWPLRSSITTVFKRAAFWQRQCSMLTTHPNEHSCLSRMAGRRIRSSSRAHTGGAGREASQTSCHQISTAHLIGPKPQMTLNTAWLLMQSRLQQNSPPPYRRAMTPHLLRPSSVTAPSVSSRPAAQRSIQRTVYLC